MRSLATTVGRFGRRCGSAGWTREYGLPTPEQREQKRDKLAILSLCSLVHRAAYLGAGGMGGAARQLVLGFAYAVRPAQHHCYCWPVAAQQLVGGESDAIAGVCGGTRR